jgi:hypothetical protein
VTSEVKQLSQFQGHNTTSEMRIYNYFHLNVLILNSIQLQNIIEVEECRSSGMLCHVALVTTDVSEELRAYFIRVTRIGELGTTLAVTSNQHK